MPKTTSNESTLKSSRPTRSPKPLYSPKDHQKWARLKSHIHNNAVKYKPYQEGEIYWFCLGDNIGVEEDGKNELYSRPALIVRGFSQSLIWIIPLSHTKRRGKYYYKITSNQNVDTALLSQIRSIDAARISGELMGNISKAELNIIKDKIKLLL